MEYEFDALEILPEETRLTGGGCGEGTCQNDSMCYGTMPTMVQ
jgi:hypothetical protein